MKAKIQKYTVAPWKLGYRHRRNKRTGRDNLAFVNAGGQTVAKCDGDNALANASLICAAPDMYHALIDWVALCENIDAGVPDYVLSVLEGLSTNLKIK